jgi:zinc protease
LSPFDLNSPWNISAIFAPQNRFKVEQALREEVARAIRDGSTAKELASGQQGLLNQRRLARAQDAGLTASLANNLYLGRTQSMSQQVDQEIAGLSLEQVSKALRKYLLLDDFQLKVVGDFKSAIEAKSSPSKG